MPPKRKKNNPEGDELTTDKLTIRIKKKKIDDITVENSQTELQINNDFSDNFENEKISLIDDYSTSLTLKPDHELRPIWITRSNLIYLEAFSPLYKQAYDFLVAIAEPESRPEFIQTYKLTENSLYAAVAVSIDTESIIRVLSRLCKTNIPNEVIEYIRTCTYTFGKAKLVLKDNAYYIESKYPEVLRELLKNPTIKNSRVFSSQDETLPKSGNPSSEVEIINKNTESVPTDTFLHSVAPQEDIRNMDYRKLVVDGDVNADDDDQDDFDVNAEGLQGTENSQSQYRSKLRTVSFMVAQQLVQDVKRSAKEDSKYPLMEEYDFKNDTRNPDLTIDLKPSTRIRPYQEKSLSKMFGNGRARSGIIVLPCGAGKSLTGVTAASTIKKSCMIICINNASVKQWKEQFTTWTSVPESCIRFFTSSSKDKLPEDKNLACIVLTTYSMICHGGNRSALGELMIQSVKKREWGLMILDEVHVAPAKMFQKVLTIVNAHCKLGLTATLVREDDKIEDLNFLVGPKLYEANWIDLTEAGYLARVECSEVWCPMTKEFYAEYIRRSKGNNSRTQRLLYTLNPCKFRTCEYLVRYHSERGDKIIIFSDDVPALILYCQALKAVKEIPLIFGGTKEDDRRDILTAFKTRAEISCIGLSKVGDTALDIPEANVIIQVSSHFGARRQEAQRLGRILRPKPNPSGGFNAFFYTLVSTDTREMFFSSKRQQYLVDQGYTFKVVRDVAEKANKTSILLQSVSKEIDLLDKVLSFNCKEYDENEDKAVTATYEGEIEDDTDAAMGSGYSQSANRMRRKNVSMNTISGGDGSRYLEFDLDS